MLVVNNIKDFIKNPNFQDAGKVPGLSTVSGIARIFRGIGRILFKPIDEKVHQIGVEKFRLNNEYRREEEGEHVINGLKDIGRGLVESIPIIGNIAVGIYDIAKGDGYPSV